MITTIPKTQSGFALLFFMVVLMGFGGVVLTGFSQQAKKEVDESRINHNREVLEAAKHALLMYAYNYPDFNSEGPGRLPCPDTDNDGFPGVVGPPVLTLPICNSVGRLPWNEVELNLYDIRDADNERLWYSVSNSFYNLGGGPIVNSDSVGTITLSDQAGNIIYDGATNGVAAVIIAPGSPLVGQTRTLDPLNPANYLDAFNGFDNSAFVNGSSALDSDGFILGPVIDNNNTLVVNDEVIFITTAEITAMAEKATLQAYRDAIDDYHNKIWPAGPATDYRYPWLVPYDIPGWLTAFDAEIPAVVVSDPVIGKLPTIFANYFTNNSTPNFQSEMDFLLNVDGHPVSARTPAGNASFLANGNLVSPFNSPSTFTGYVWDGHATLTDANSPQDGVWEACAGTAGTGPGGTTFLEDNCNRKADGTFKTPLDANPAQSDVWLEVREVSFTFNGVSPFQFLATDLTSAPAPLPPPLIYKEPDVANHAYVSADYTRNGLDFIPVVTWSEDIDFQSGFTETPFPNNGLLIFDAADTISVGVRYYPELPAWVLDNNWHDKMQMAYSSAVQPGGDGACTVPVFPVAVDNDYCLSLLNSGGAINNKNALLVMSGADIDGDADLGFVDGGLGPNFFADDLGDVFEAENSTDALPYGGNYGILENNLTFDRRPANGNDIVHVLR